MKNFFFIIACTNSFSCSEKEEIETNPAEQEIEEPPQESEPEDNQPEEPTQEESNPEQEDEPAQEEDANPDVEFDICVLAQEERIVLELPTVEEEAPQLTLIPGSGETYTLTKLAENDGWFVLDVPSWMCEVQLYTTEGVTIELQHTPDWELGDVGEVITECEEDGMIRYSWVFHAWGSYIVQIQAPEQSDIWLASVMHE